MKKFSMILALVISIATILVLGVSCGDDRNVVKVDASELKNATYEVVGIGGPVDEDGDDKYLVRPMMTIRITIRMNDGLDDASDISVVMDGKTYELVHKSNGVFDTDIAIDKATTIKVQGSAK